jgi:hypothetical protein
MHEKGGVTMKSALLAVTPTLLSMPSTSRRTAAASSADMARIGGSGRRCPSAWYRATSAAESDILRPRLDAF